MHAALGGVDVVGEGEDGLVIAVVVLHSDLRYGVVLLARHVDDMVVKHVLALVQPGDELPDTTLEAHVVFLLLAGALVHDMNAQAGVQEGLLPHAGVEGLVIVDGVLEHLRVRLEGDGGAGVVRCADNFHLLGDMAP